MWERCSEVSPKSLAVTGSLAVHRLAPRQPLGEQGLHLDRCSRFLDTSFTHERKDGTRKRLQLLNEFLSASPLPQLPALLEHLQPREREVEEDAGQLCEQALREAWVLAAEPAPSKAEDHHPGGKGSR